MTERAAHRVDVLLPFPRVRQRVLTVPWSRRWDLALVKIVLAEALDVLQDTYAKRAGLLGGRTGSIAIRTAPSGMDPEMRGSPRAVVHYRGGVNAACPTGRISRRSLGCGFMTLAGG
jgi:hypothetical protein